MQILGQGHNGIVVAGEFGTVQKFYRVEPEWESEKFSLEFLAHMQDFGFRPAYIIPRLISSATGKWEINGKAYLFCNTMQRVSGSPADKAVNEQNLGLFGETLGEILFHLHHYSKSFVTQFQKNTKTKNVLLRHIIDDKFGKINSEESDVRVKEWAGEAAEYLERRLPQLINELTLTHVDLSLSNILIKKDGKINGLVDWGFFSPTHPSLSLYQLVTNPDIWSSVKKHYEALGGAIREDIVYAASTVHLAWAPLICKELGETPDEYETANRFNEIYERFKNCKVI